MIPERFVTHPPYCSRRLSRIAMGAACVLVSSTIAACASASPHNPSRLGGEQLGRVAGICQSVMGLSPSDPPGTVWAQRRTRA